MRLKNSPFAPKGPYEEMVQGQDSDRGCSSSASQSLLTSAESIAGTLGRVAMLGGSEERILANPIPDSTLYCPRAEATVHIS
jgi:hypothetical protein